MRLLNIISIFALAFLLVVPAWAWENSDYEIFELQAALESSEGKGTTFYSMLNLTKEATAQQIKTAYRKRSVELHPDKHPQNPSAAKRFERLGLINKILRDERKDRYDHFLTTGFPKWRGTGYFYERFRPGLISVIVGIIGLTVLVEHMIKRLNFTRDLSRVSQLRRAALFQAWGPRFFQVLHNTKNAPVVAQEKKIKLQVAFLPELPAGPSAAEVQQGKVDWDALEKEVRRSALASGGAAPLATGHAPRTVDVLVTRESDGEGIVWLLDPTSGEFSEINEEKMIRPTFKESWPLRVVRNFREGKAGEEAVDVAAQGAEAVSKAKETVASSTAVKKSKGGGRKR